MITFCNNTTSYLSPFSELVKGNGAPHANSVKLHAVTLFRCSEAAILTMKTLTETRLWSEGEAA
jgi:hypothetical protein